PRLVTGGLLAEAGDELLVRRKAHRPEASRRLDGGHRGEDAAALVEANQLSDVDVADAVAVREAEGLVGKVLPDPAHTAAGHRLLAGVDQRHAPRLDGSRVDDRLVLAEVEGDVGAL